MVAAKTAQGAMCGCVARLEIDDALRFDPADEDEAARFRFDTLVAGVSVVRGTFGSREAKRDEVGSACMRIDRGRRLAGMADADGFDPKPELSGRFDQRSTVVWRRNLLREQCL